MASQGKTSMNAEDSGVLVIATGGNVCLTTVMEQGVEVLRQAGLVEISRIILGGEEETVILREVGILAQQLRVNFRDLRKNEDEFADPELLDSSQVNPLLWTELAQLIGSEYQKYEGFVILHGLDTMAYSASALSFMLGDLDKPVILTGSQRPLNFMRTDAVQNIVSAITFAGANSLGLHPVIREVAVYSYDTLFRGNRVSMVSASSYRSFDTSNYPALATAGAHSDIQTHLVRSRKGGRRLDLKASASAKVQIIDVFPGIDPEIFRGIYRSNQAIRAARAASSQGRPRKINKATSSNQQDYSEEEETQEPVKGVLLRTYGLGTAPTEKKFLAALEDLVESGVVVVNVTQARSGRISYSLDPVTLRLFEHGVVSGVDMTSEAAYAKMVTLLSHETDPGKAADLIQLDRCGEQSQSIFTFHFGAGKTEYDRGAGTRNAIATLKPVREMTERHLVTQPGTVIRAIQLRILGIRLSPPPERVLNRAVPLDAYLVDQEQRIPLIVGELKRQHTLTWSAHGRETINAAFDITGSRDQLLSAGTMLRIDTFEPVEWKRLSIVVYAEVEGGK